MAEKTPGTDSGKPGGEKPAPTLTTEQFDAFMADGKMPSEREPDPEPGEEADPASEAAADKPVEQAAPTGAQSKPDPASGDPTKTPKKHGQKKNAADRAAEIEAQADEAEQRLQKALERRRRAVEAAEAIEREDTSKAKSAEKGAEAAAAAKDVPAWKKYAEMPGAPKPPSIDDPKFKGIDEYMAALNEHNVAMGYFIAEKVAEEKAGSTYDQRFKQQQDVDAQEREFQTSMADCMDRMAKELEADPEIVDRIPQRWRDLNPSNKLQGQQLTPAHFVKDQAMFNSDHPLKVSEALCKDNFAELRRIAQLSPERIIREIARIDAKFDREDPSDDTSDEATTEAASHPKVSKAQAPGKVLGKKAAAGKDPLKQAIAENDFDTFNAIESQRERAVAR